MNPHRTPWTKRASTRYRELLKLGRPLVAAGAPGAWHASLLEKAGIDLIYSGGNNVMRPLMGVAAEVVSSSEFVWLNHWIARGSNAPVIADTDTGFGGHRRLSRVAEELIMSGVASARVEDKAAIKAPGWVDRSPMAPIDESISRIRAIAEIRDTIDPDFVIQAYCKILDDSDDFDEAIARLKAYQAAGADVLHINVKSLDQVRAARQKLSGPLVCTGINAGDVPGLLTVEDHAREGLSVVWYSNLLIWYLNIKAIEWLDLIKRNGYGEWIKFREQAKAHPQASVFVQQHDVDTRMQDFERTVWPPASTGPDEDGWEYQAGRLEMPGWEWLGGDPSHKVNWRKK
jgi:2,3-dimethylmalate lyase